MEIHPQELFFWPSGMGINSCPTFAPSRLCPKLTGYGNTSVTGRQAEKLLVSATAGACSINGQKSASKVSR